MCGEFPFLSAHAQLMATFLSLAASYYHNRNLSIKTLTIGGRIIPESDSNKQSYRLLLKAEIESATMNVLNGKWLRY